MKLHRTIALGLTMLILAGCAPATTPSPSGQENPTVTQPTVTEPTVTEPPATEPTVTEEPQPTEKKEYSILFIGNSYTYYNKLPQSIFTTYAAAAGYRVEVTAITNGGYKLSEFADPEDPFGAKVMEALTGEKKYDFVVLQEQSVTPASNRPAFYKAVRTLVEMVRASGAQPILYSTWGRADGSDTLTKYGWTRESMTWKVAAAYDAIGRELDVPVAHVGLAFFDICENQPDIQLYASDLTHPSYMGSFLAASCLFATIFQRDPTTVPYNGTIITGEAPILREAARKAIYETPAIPDEYALSSEGIGI